MNPFSGISSVATGGCASAWCGVFAGRSVGARSRTSVPARSSRKIRAPFVSAADRGAGRSPVATTRIKLNSKRLVMPRGIVTTPRGPGQRTLRRLDPSHRREHYARLLLVDEVPRSEEHTSELQSPCNLVCRLLLEKKKKKQHDTSATSN